MIQTLGQTTNFTVTYQDTFPNALQRAQALKQQCESDFGQLKTIFGVSAGFGSSNRVTLRVDQASLASNNGYHSDGSSAMVINPFDTLANQAQADDAVQALFVAEIVEVLMSYNNQHSGTATWNPGGSDGEGLSRMLAGLWHPNGYYNVLGGPFVNGWLQTATRTNWVSTIESTDTDSDSFGCALLFLYYLYSQLGYDLKSIITKAGTTLEATYEALTGSSGGYSAFTQLLTQFFPLGNTNALATDDPFPLQLTASGRHVTLSATQVSTGTSSVSSTGQATVTPPLCEQAGTYTYWIDDVPAKLKITAEVEGFGQPLYSWKVNGHQLSAIGGTINTTATVLTDNPNDPTHPHSSSENVELFSTVVFGVSNYQREAGELDITASGFPGHIELNVECDVTERFIANGATVGFASPLLDTQNLRYDDQYYIDSANCRAAWEALMRRLVRYKHILIILTLPDPPPYLERAIAVINEIERELVEIGREDPALARQLGGLLTRQLGAPTHWLEGRINQGEEKSG